MPNTHSVVAIGVDIELIMRFRLMLNNKKLLRTIFSKKELEYCFSKQNAEQHLAVRYSAKEAVRKAYGSLTITPPPFNSIIVHKRTNGAPYISIKGSKYFFLVSLSHDETHALAFVTLLH